MYIFFYLYFSELLVTLLMVLISRRIVIGSDTSRKTVVGGETNVRTKKKQVQVLFIFHLDKFLLSFLHI